MTEVKVTLLIDRPIVFFAGISIFVGKQSGNQCFSFSSLNGDSTQRLFLSVMGKNNYNNKKLQCPWQVQKKLPVKAFYVKVG